MCVGGTACSLRGTQLVLIKEGKKSLSLSVCLSRRRSCCGYFSLCRNKQSLWTKSTRTETPLSTSQLSTDTSPVYRCVLLESDNYYQRNLTSLFPLYSFQLWLVLWSVSLDHLTFPPSPPLRSDWYLSRTIRRADWERGLRGAED